MTDFQEYESLLRTEIARVEKQAEAAWGDLMALKAHPASGEYKMHQHATLMTSGTLTGLLRALQLLTGEDFEAEYTEKLQVWMKRSN